MLEMVNILHILRNKDIGLNYDFIIPTKRSWLVRIICILCCWVLWHLYEMKDLVRNECCVSGEEQDYEAYAIC
jgi:hypothetical protein